MKAHNFAKVLAVVAVVTAFSGVASAAMMVKKMVAPTPTVCTTTSMPKMHK
jgi:hypothetical protein